MWQTHKLPWKAGGKLLSLATTLSGLWSSLLKPLVQTALIDSKDSLPGVTGYDGLRG
jgi:hypothetical protein